MSGPLRRIAVDGVVWASTARALSVRLSRRDREGLALGDRVLLVDGDGPPQEAEVTAVTANVAYVELRLFSDGRRDG